jgi:hypothetical protein
VVIVGKIAVTFLFLTISATLTPRPLYGEEIQSIFEQVLAQSSRGRLLEENLSHYTEKSISHFLPVISVSPSEYHRIAPGKEDAHESELRFSIIQPLFPGQTLSAAGEQKRMLRLEQTHRLEQVRDELFMQLLLLLIEIEIHGFKKRHAEQSAREAAMLVSAAEISFRSGEITRIGLINLQFLVERRDLQLQISIRREQLLLQQWHALTGKEVLPENGRELLDAAGNRGNRWIYEDPGKMVLMDRVVKKDYQMQLLQLEKEEAERNRTRGIRRWVPDISLALFGVLRPGKDREHELGWSINCSFRTPGVEIGGNISWLSSDALTHTQQLTSMIEPGALKPGTQRDVETMMQIREAEIGQETDEALLLVYQLAQELPLLRKETEILRKEQQLMGLELAAGRISLHQYEKISARLLSAETGIMETVGEELILKVSLLLKGGLRDRLLSGDEG